MGASTVYFSRVFLRDVATLWVNSVFLSLDRKRRFILVVVPFRCSQPFLGSSHHIHTSSFGLSELLVAGGRAIAWLVTVL